MAWDEHLAAVESAERRLAAWEQRYRAGTTAWERGELSPAFLSWTRSGVLKPPGRVLVPGAGRSPEPLALARRGFAVTAVDIAPTPAKAADALNIAAWEHASLDPPGPALEWVQADLLSWEPSVPFDAVYEQTCLCALHPDHWEAYAARLTRWTSPGGRLFALFMQCEEPGGPPYHCDLARMKTLFSRAWKWPDASPQRVPHPAGIEELAVVIERLP